MRYVGVDLHKRFLVVHAEDEHGVRKGSGRFDSQDRTEIVRFFEKLKPFRCVIEASCSYRWFHELASPELAELDEGKEAVGRGQSPSPTV